MKGAGAKCFFSFLGLGLMSVPVSRIFVVLALQLASWPDGQTAGMSGRQSGVSLPKGHAVSGSRQLLRRNEFELSAVIFLELGGH